MSHRDVVFRPLLYSSMLFLRDGFHFIVNFKFSHDPLRLISVGPLSVVSTTALKTVRGTPADSTTQTAVV